MLDHQMNDHIQLVATCCIHDTETIWITHGQN